MPYYFRHGIILSRQDMGRTKAYQHIREETAMQVHTG